MTKLKIKKGDKVIITTGRKEIKGKTGEIIEVIRKEGKDPRVVVAGLNIVKRHRKPSAQNPQGGVEEKEASIHISNVALVDKEGKAIKVGFKKIQGERNGKKKEIIVRVNKKTGETL
ncbi:MAG: 50S ribosomal protein L24 [Bergeyella sp.]|nr:50S ribosomal protein L24 [Bergeyella sp.]